MAEQSAIARPYARALFELAREQDALPSWSDALRFAAEVAQNPELAALAANPRVDREQLEQLLIELCRDHMPEQGVNLLRLLVRNRRLGALPGIAVQFEQLRAEAERITDAEIITARPISDDQRRGVQAALSERLGRAVRLTVVEDPGLIGGAVIRAGDVVIDGSARGRLEKLSAALAR